MQKINGFINEKGNVSSTHRSLVRSQVIDYICDKTDFSMTPNNSLYMQIAEAEDGTPIYAVIELAITVADPTIVKEKKAKASKEKEPVEIPTLF